MEGTALTFQVPWVALCSDNRKYVTGYILSKEYRESKQLIGELSLAHARRAGWVRTDQQIGIRIIVTEPDRRRRDFNWSKNLKDGITQGEGIWFDDSQVRDEHWQFAAPNKHHAGAIIRVWILTPSFDTSA